MSGTSEEHRPARANSDRFEWKLAAAFLLFLALFTFDAWLAGASLGTVTENGTWVLHSQQVLGQIHASLSSLKDAETGQRGYLITGRPEYLEPYNTGVQAVHDHLARLKELTRDNRDQQTRTVLLQDVVQKKLLEMQEVLDTRQVQGDEAARQRVLLGRGLETMDEARRLTADLDKYETDLLQQRQRRSARSEQAARISFGISFILSVGLLAAFFLFITRSLRDRQTAALAVKEREARISAILETAMDAIVTIDYAGRVMEWNSVAVSLFGHSREDAVGKEMATLIIPPDARDRHRIGLKRYFETGEGPILNKRIEVNGLHVSGSEIPIELSITPIHERGRATIFTAFIRDLREKRRQEREHDRLTNYNRLLLESTAEGILGLNRDGHCTFINRSGARILGYDSDELIGQRIHDLTHHHFPDGTVYPAEECPMYGPLRDHEIHRGDNEHFFRKNGDVFPVEFASVPLREEGRLVGAVVTFSDISARKQAEEDLLAAKDAAETANRTKSQFLANMSHELRTPLNAIIGYSEMLADDAEESGSDALADLQKINKAGKHLLSLISDVLDLSKVEAGKMDLFIEEFDVAEMAQDVVATMAPLVEKNRNRLTVELEDGIGSMSSDFTKVRQNLFNLLSNATKFTEDGQVGLAIRRSSHGGVEGFEFRISDTGVGMSPEQLSRLFQPFAQADASTTRRFGGTGLGLAITSHFCRMLGGDIDVQSESGRGSTFTMWLPTVINPGAPRSDEEESHDAVDPQSHNALILVIDDDPASRELLQRSLVKEGYRVALAANGEQGLRMARELHPTAITLDVMMPSMDGWTVLKRLKDDSELAGIPVIMLTMLNNRNLGIRLGASDYMTKPINRSRLISLLERYRCCEPPCNVLLVEDDVTTREMMREILEKEQWSVIEAENGQVALTQIEKAVPSLILLDLMMPRMDGFALAAALQSKPEWASIPIIVLTAKDITTEDLMRLNGSVEKVLQKGASSRELILREIRDLVSRGGAEEARAQSSGSVATGGTAAG